MGPPTTTTTGGWQAARRLLQAQIDHCAARGIACKRLALPAPQPNEEGPACVHFPYQLSVPYAGAVLEMVVTLPMPLSASSPPPPEGGKRRPLGSLWDDEEEEGEESRPLLPLPDILPLGLKHAPTDGGGGGSSTSIEAPYQAFPPWSALYPLLASKWDARRPGALLAVVEELRSVVARRQAAGALDFPDETTRFDLEMAAGVEGVEILTRTTLAGHEATVLLPLLPTPAAGGDDDEDDATTTTGEQEAAAAAAGGLSQSQGGGSSMLEGGGEGEEEEDRSVYPPGWLDVRLQVIFRVEGIGGALGREAEARVINLPPSLPLAKEAVEKRRLPSLGTETMLLDYREQVRSQILTPWAKRRELVRVLGANFALLECDAAEYGAATLLLKITREGEPPITPTADAGVLCHFSLPFDFPQQSPQMSLIDFASNGPVVTLDRQEYRYSPRWDAKRMARELVAHAVEEARYQMRQKAAGGGGGGGGGKGRYG